MATQRYISTSFWDDPWISTLEPKEKLLYLYLMTCPLTNIAGVYEITIRRVEFDTGITNDNIIKMFDKFEKDKKSYYYNHHIIIPTWPKHQKWEGRTKIKDGIISVLQDIKKDILLYLQDIEYCFDLSLVDKTIISSKIRTNISGSTIKNVYEKNNNACSDCGSEENLNIHHIKPLKKGGDNSKDNLTVLCFECHVKKHSPDKVSGTEFQSRYDRNYLDSDLEFELDSDIEKEISTLPVRDFNKDWDNLREYWKASGFGEYRKPLIHESDYGPLANILNLYTYEEMGKAIDNYKEANPEYKYQSFRNFITKGLEKFYPGAYQKETKKIDQYNIGGPINGF